MNKLYEIFLDVLEVNIAVSIVFLIILLLAGKLRKRYGALWLKAVWLLLAVRLLIPYNLSLPAGIRLPDLSAQPTVEAEGAKAPWIGKQAGAWTPKEEMRNKEQGQDSPEAYNSPEESEDMAGAAGEEANPYFAPAPSGANNIFAPLPSGEKEILPGMRVSYRTIMLISILLPVIGMRIWIWGMALCFIYHMISYGIFGVRFKRSLQPITDTAMKRQIDSWQKKRLGKLRLKAYQSTMAGSPMIVGIIYPKLVLPVQKEAWPEKELEFIVSHELCHYQKKDLWQKLLMTAAWCVNWFNPLVYLLKRQFYFEMELACDAQVLSGCDAGERESYARTMLSFAGGHGREAFCSTGFSGGKKKMKQRIDYMLEEAGKKRGLPGMIVTGLMILSMGLMISCSYQKDEDRNTSLGEADGSGAWDGEQQAPEKGDSEQEDIPQGDMQKGGSNSAEELNVPFTVNNEYNEMLRCYGDDRYLGREDGIYRLSRDGEGEELVYANDYNMRRGMEIYQDHLYFCGSAKRGEQEAATIYRMDLNSFEVEDALALFSNVFDSLYHITIYEDNLYVASGYSQRIGFRLDEEGRIIGRLDEQAEDFLFKEDNEYWGLQLKIWNNEVVYDSEEYWDTVEQMSGMYRGLIDLAACERMLNGDQVVMKYKDELLSSVYLKKKDGDYEFLCDVNSYPPLVTETGIYYFGDESNSAIWYVDYETKTRRKIWEREDRKHREIQLVNYDQEYIYVTASNEIGRDVQNDNILRETYLMRIPRWQEGAAEKIYQFELEMRIGSLQRNCAVADGKMFFRDYKTISLDPARNKMERLNSGELSEDAAAMKQTLEDFANAYFQNDEETLKSCLTADFEDRIELYPYPEQAGVIEGTYISGLPDGNLPVGVSCFVSYEFRGHAETNDEDALSYLSVEMIKTDQGWKISFYGLEI